MRSGILDRLPSAFGAQRDNAVAVLDLETEEITEIQPLEVSTIDGDLDGDGDYDQLFSYGTRSFSIWDSQGNLVFDSGDEFAKITTEQLPELFTHRSLKFLRPSEL